MSDVDAVDDLFDDPAGPPRNLDNGILVVKVGAEAKTAFVEEAQRRGMIPSQAMREAFRDWMKKS